MTERSLLVFVGCTKPHVTVRNGTRCSTARAYLRPALSRRNLHVVTEAHTSKVSVVEISDVEREKKKLMLVWQSVSLKKF